MKNSALILALTAGIAGTAMANPGREPATMSKSKIAEAYVAGHVYVNVADGTRVQTALTGDDAIVAPRGTDPLWINDGPLCQDPNGPGFVFLNTSINDDPNNTPTNPNDDTLFPAITMNWGDIPLGSSVTGMSFSTTADRAANLDGDGDGTADSIADIDTIIVLFDQENGFSSTGRVAVFGLRINDVPAPATSPAPLFASFIFTVDFDTDLVGSPISVDDLGTVDLDSDGLGDFGWGQFYLTSVGGVDAGITSGPNLDRFGQAFAEPVGYPSPVAPQAQGVEDAFDIQDLDANFDIQSLATGAGTYFFGGYTCPLTATTGNPLSAFQFSLFTGASDPCLAIDFTGDGTIDSGDLAAFIGGFIAQNVAFDLTNDGQVDSGDLAAFITLFLQCV
jgi:hypothetical protein